MRRLLVLAALASAVLPAAPATAATIVVGNGCSIVDAIKAANTNTPQGGCRAGSANFSVRDTVVLETGATYTFTAPYAPEVGPAPEATALPHLASVLTIEGNGATLERSAAPGTPRFRLLRASAGDVVVNRLTLRGGDQTTGGGVGGGMYASSAFVTLNDVTVEDNRADTGGGIAGTSPFTLNRVSVRRNAAELTRGGGLLLLGTSVVRDSTIADNAAASHGGGIFSELVSSQSLTLLRSTVSGNEAGYGGGLHVAGPTTIGNSTISGNHTTSALSVEHGGAGIYAFGFGTTTLVNSTVAGNRTDAPGQTAGIFLGHGTLRFANSIVVGNTSNGSPTATSADCKLSFWGGTFASDGDNVFGWITGCPSSSADAVADGNAAFTTVLRPLATNPPGSLETHRLQRLSPALDGGNPAVCAADPIAGVDQRGVSRVDNAPCDIGAYEAERADLELTGPSGSGRPAVGTNVTLNLTLRNVGPAPATGVAVRAPIPEGLTLVSSGSGYDPATGLWTLGSLAKAATASLSIVARVDRHALFEAEVEALDQEDPDSTPANEAAGEDDLVRVAVTPPGIWVNTTDEAVRDDGLCNIVEAVFAAESDTAPYTTPGECTAGDGPDTIHLQPSARYVSTDIWLSGDAFPAISTAITIEGNGARLERGVTPKYFRAFEIESGGTLTLRQLGIHYFEARDEMCGGAIRLYFGSLVLDDVFLSQNRVRDSSTGGGAVCNVLGRLTATNSRIEDNTVDVSESSIPVRGGGIATNGEWAETTLTNTSIRNNVVTSGSYASGGGLDVVHGGTLTLVGGAVRENRIVLTGLTSKAFGGGVSADGVNEPAVVKITGTTLTDNRVDAVPGNRTAHGGALALRLASATLTDAIVGDVSSAVANFAAGGGGGIYVDADADLGMIRGEVSSNESMAAGAGILSDGGLVDLRHVDLTGNESDDGAGGAIRTSGRLVIVGGTISQNIAYAGAGIDNQFGSLDIDGTRILGNQASLGGAAIRMGGDGSATIRNATISDNKGGGIGGGIWTDSVTTLVDTVVTNNRLISEEGCGTAPSCPGGGGIYATDELTLVDSEVRSNVASGDSYGGGVWSAGFTSLLRSRVTQNAARVGGGLFSEDGQLATERTTFDVNNAYSGGGIFVNGGSAFVASSTLDGNRATYGGGAALVGTTTTLVNTTVSRNAADVAGAVHNGLDTNLFVVASTITANDALQAGGISSVLAGDGAIRSSIVAGNRSQESGFPDCDGSTGSELESRGSNLFAGSGGCDVRSVDRLVDGDVVSTEVVSPLADNGGGTLTHELRRSSPAIDAAGSSCAEDQRGLPRPRDGDGDGVARCDIGAVEQQGVHQAPLTITGLEPSVVAANTPASRILLTGTGFTPETRVRIGSGPFQPTEYWNAGAIRASLPGDAYASDVDIKTLPITAQRQDGAVAVAPLTIVRQSVDSAQSATVVAGSSSTVSATPTTVGLGAVSGTLTNTGGGPATVTAAVYKTNPTGGTTFSSGGFVDLQVTGADNSDRLTARFYYPLNVIGDPERQLELRYWTGSAWRAVRGQGGARPVKDMTNNPDGTGMGGKFTVTFGNTSTPRITELSGTVLATDLDQVSPETTASVTAVGGSNGWHTENPTVTLDATDDDSGVARTEWAAGSEAFATYGGPFEVSTEGVNAIRYYSVDEAGNVEPERSLEIKLDRSLPAASVSPLPAETSSTAVSLTWGGSDGVSGIASYDVYASVDGGQLTPWRTGTFETSGIYVGEPGRTYGFAAVATDVAGNAEALPIAPETTVRIVAQAPPPPTPAPPPPPASPQPPPPAPRPKPKPKPKPKVTICFKKRTIKVPKSQVAKYKKRGAKVGACKKPKRKPRR